MAITRETMAHKLAAYSHHEIFLAIRLTGRGWL
jgi:hypothetical protein